MKNKVRVNLTPTSNIKIYLNYSNSPLVIVPVLRTVSL